MATRRGPTLRSQWLGQRLRELREGAGLTLRDVATFTQRDPSSLSRMEAGIHPARVPDVLAYLSLCGDTDAQQREVLLTLAKDSWQTGWWDRYLGEYGPLVDRIWLETRAIAIESFEGLVLPGHLQTPDYAAAVMRAHNPARTPAERERDVQLRMERKERIHSRSNLKVTVVVDEAILHRRIGGTAAMRAQLHHLIEMINTVNVALFIIPLVAGAYSSMDGGFDILRLEPPYGNVGYVHSPAGTVFLEGDEVDRLEERYRRLIAVALDEVDSLKLISRLIGEIEQP